MAKTTKQELSARSSRIAVLELVGGGGAEDARAQQHHRQRVPQAVPPCVVHEAAEDHAAEAACTDGWWATAMDGALCKRSECACRCACCVFARRFGGRRLPSKHAHPRDKEQRAASAPSWRIPAVPRVAVPEQVSLRDRRVLPSLSLPRLRRTFRPWVCRHLAMHNASTSMLLLLDARRGVYVGFLTSVPRCPCWCVPARRHACLPALPVLARALITSTARSAGPALPTAAALVPTPANLGVVLWGGFLVECSSILRCLSWCLSFEGSS